MKKIKQLIWMLAMVALICSGCAHGNRTNSEAETVSPAAREISQPDASNAISEAEDEDFEEEDEEGLSDTEEVPEPDPLHLWNLTWFHFNDTFYFAVLKPVASAYGALFPIQVRKGIKNFFHNISGPKRFISCLLQGKGAAAESEFVRFFMNTTVGVLGFGNPANRFDHLNPPEEDLGQTLGAYGLKEGVFIVWPLLGPSSLRDTVGFAADSFLSPATYLDSTETRVGIRALELVNDTSFRIGDYEALKEAAIDPYESIRDAYIQYRRKMVLE